MSITLHGEQVILRPQLLSDTDNLYQILSNQEVMKYYPRVYSREESKSWVTRNMVSYTQYGYGLWAVEREGSFIGQCGITNQNYNGKIVQELGFHIDNSHWRKGIAYEASVLCLKYAFNTLELQNIYVITAIDNIPAQGLAMKLGMTTSGGFIKEFSDSSKVEHVAFKLSKDEFNTSQNPTEE